MTAINLIKQGFFDKSVNSAHSFSFKDQDFDLNQLNFEFLTVYQLIDLNKNSLQKDCEIVLYLQWLCNLLIYYYQCDYVANDLKNLREKKQKIDSFIANNLPFEPLDFSYFLQNKIKKETVEFMISFKSSSKIRAIISSLMTNRTYWNYSRSFAKILTLYLLQSSLSILLLKINQFIGLYCSPEYFLKLVELPKEILRISSFSLNLLRLVLNLLMAIKHIFNALISPELSAKKVLIQELEKRAYLLANDTLWGIVNSLSSYYQLLGISLAIITYLNLAAYSVDLLLFAAKLIYEKYVYNQRVNELNLQKMEAQSPLQLALINRQIDILKDEWEVNCYYFLFNITAALLFIFVVTATLLWSGPFFLLAIAGLNMLGNALYNSCEEFKRYKQDSIAVQRELLNQDSEDTDYKKAILNELNNRTQKSQNDFLKTLVFNAVFSSIILVTASFCWPLAALITLSYIAYKIWDSYEQEQQQKITKTEPNIYRLFSEKKSEFNSENKKKELVLI